MRWPFLRPNLILANSACSPHRILLGTNHGISEHHRPSDRFNTQPEANLHLTGAAQDLLKKGLDTAAIMQAGGWKSVNVLARYLEHAEHNVWA